jgi:hypothetical protein
VSAPGKVLTTYNEGPRTINADDAATVYENGLEAGTTYGFGYWGLVTKWPAREDSWDKRELEHPSVTALRNGVAVSLWEHEDNNDEAEGGTVHELTAAALLEGIAAVAEKRGVAPWALVDNCDGPDADLCIQFALFKEERYA